jgi:lipopolysaccharide transport system permease protein
MMVVYGIAPTVAILWLPLVMAMTVLLGVAISFPAALLGLWFRDLQPFAINCVRALFFVAPGIVPLSEVAPESIDWLKLNPLTGLFEAYRDVLLYGTSPAPWELLYPAAWAALLLAVFVPIYRSDSPHFAKVLG